MKKSFVKVSSFAILLLVFIACNKKDQVLSIPKPTPPVPVKDVKVKVKAFVEVGTIIYDSLPAIVKLTSWDSAGVAATKELSLNPGENEIILAGKYTRHLLKLEKWAVTAEKELLQKDLKENMVIRIGTKKDAKNLKSESYFQLSRGTYIPLANTDYHYNADGTLKQIDYHEKGLHSQSIVLRSRDKFAYEAGKVVRIQKVNEGDEPTVLTQISYDENNLIRNMQVNGFGQEKFATVHRGREDANELININYRWNQGASTMNYSMKFFGGNMIQDHSSSSTGTSERGSYQYDFNINPFHQMKRPDLSLANSSKNNRISETKSFTGQAPDAILDKVEYTYDTDGYPIRCIRSYKSIQGNHMYDAKTVYEYY